MSGSYPFADAHIHVTDPGFGDRYRDIRDATVLFGCTARPSEWDPMSAVKDLRVVRFYGVHPWYADEWNDESETRLRSIMSTDSRAHVGEIGLDSKHGAMSEQIPALEDQLDIASEFGRMANIHMVGCEKEVLEAVRRHGRGCRAIILHSFSNESYIKPFTEAGCLFSLNPRIVARSGTRLKRLLDSIPEGSLLLETDAPYTARNFEGMEMFARSLAAVAGSDYRHILDVSLENARRIADV